MNEHDPNLLAAHLEGRLEAEEEQRLLRHLTECAGCRRALALLGRSAGDLLPWRESGSRAADSWVLRGRWLSVAAMFLVATALAIRFAAAPHVAPGDAPATNRPVPTPRVGPETVPAPNATGSAPVAAPTTGAPGPATTEGIGESLLVKRGAERRLGEKTFRLVEGQWVDLAIDPGTALPTVDVKGAEARAAILSKIPSLAPYAGLGERVRVSFEGTVYCFSP